MLRGIKDRFVGNFRTNIVIQLYRIAKQEYKMIYDSLNVLIFFKTRIILQKPYSKCDIQNLYRNHYFDLYLSISYR